MVSSSVYSQNPKGIVNDFAKFRQPVLIDKNTTEQSLYTDQQMTSDHRTNSHGQLALFRTQTIERNTLDRLSTSLPKITNDDIENELRRRENVANNFTQRNINLIKEINKLYKSIPFQNFANKVNGQFSAHLIFKKKYSLINGHELAAEVPCLIKVEDNKLTQIFPYGKKGFELDYPKEMPLSSYLSNGLVQYKDIKTKDTLTVVLLDPYLFDNPKQYRVNNKGYGFITFYTSQKREEGRIVWIQEIDENGNVFREMSQPLVYAKNEDSIITMNIKPIAINTGYDLYYFGDTTITQYGALPLFLKTSEFDTKPLNDNENRFVRIEIYRD